MNPPPGVAFKHTAPRFRITLTVCYARISVTAVPHTEARAFGKGAPVSIQTWSDTIRVAELQDDPAFTDDVVSLTEHIEASSVFDIVLDFRGVNYLNSSNIAKLLRLRKAVILKGRRLVLCNVGTQVWSMFLVTGLEKVFEFADNVDTALLGVQLAGGAVESE